MVAFSRSIDGFLHYDVSARRLSSFVKDFPHLVVVCPSSPGTKPASTIQLGLESKMKFLEGFRRAEKKSKSRNCLSVESG
jgi:hypothetical protein